MVLTTSYQKVKETKMGDWGYGTLYLRTFAKINSQSTADNTSSVNVKSVVYNNGDWCESGNCYNTLMGEKKKNNVWIKFNNGETTLGEVTLSYTHDEQGDKSISLTNTFKCYGLGSTTFSANVTVDLPKINRMDKATALDFDIGSSTLVTITKYNSSYTRTVVASVGSFSETLLEKSTETQYSWTPDADSLYEQVTTSNTGTITLTTTTYNGDTIVGTPQTSTVKCRVTDSNPTISAVIVTDSIAVVANDVLVRYMSIPKFEIRALGTNYATIKSYSVTELNSSEISSSTNNITLSSTVKNNSFLIKVTDSRNNFSTVTITSNNFVEYNLPAISRLDLVRSGENLDKVQANITGVWFNKSINGVTNTASLKYRYKTTDGEYSNYIDIAATPTSEQYLIETTLEPEGGFDTNTIYTIEVVITDNLTSGNLTAVIGKAIPLIDHWSVDDKDYYNINAEIQQYGNAIVKEQNILWSGASYMNESQSIYLSENVSQQKNGVVLVWSRYTNETAHDDSFNFVFVPKHFIGIKSGYGITSIISGTGFKPIGCKYVYISNNKITGNAVNNDTATTTNGITFTNNEFVLRYVIGV